MPRNERYSPKEVKKMAVDPYIKGDIYEAYPFLKELYEEEAKKAEDAERPFPSTDFNNLWRAIALAYDPDSPMMDITDPQTRKKMAYSDFGLPKERDAEFRQLALRYVIMCKKPLWTLIVCNEMVFEDYAAKVTHTQEGAGMDVLKAQELQGKMLTMMNTMADTIRNKRKEFFGNDVELEEAGQKFTPEKVAQSMRKTT